MENVEPELVVGQPRIAREAEQLLDLRADVDGIEWPGSSGWTMSR